MIEDPVPQILYSLQDKDNHDKDNHDENNHNEDNHNKENHKKYKHNNYFFVFFYIFGLFCYWCYYPHILIGLVVVRFHQIQFKNIIIFFLRDWGGKLITMITRRREGEGGGLTMH